MALNRMVEVGDKVEGKDGKVHTIIAVNDDIAVIDHWLPEHQEYNCFIARFSDGEYNAYFTLKNS